MENLHLPIDSTTDSTKDCVAANRLVPPGQFITKKFPALTWGTIPHIELDQWRFQVFGLVENELSLDLKDFQSFEFTTIQSDFHCVTGWSHLDTEWTGVLFADIAKLIRPLPQANYAYIRCYGGYTTNLSIRTLTDAKVMLAFAVHGEPLVPAHGGPLRLIVPNRYAWKSAKWVHSIEFLEQDRLGFWEQRGYHARGNPWLEERTSK